VVASVLVISFFIIVLGFWHSLLRTTRRTSGRRGRLIRCERPFFLVPFRPSPRLAATA